jgi:hypothetical protein
VNDDLKSAREYLALSESNSEGNATDMLQLSIAHSLAGILDWVSQQASMTNHTIDSEWEESSTPEEATDTAEVPKRRCALCGRLGQRWYETTPVGLICSHYVKCADRREANAA